MPRDMTVSDSVIIAAPASTLWEAVADPSQMPRWSPENTRGDVPTPGTTLGVGSSFVGANKRGRARWHTRCVVTESDPGRRFTFDVRAIGLRNPRMRVRIATWSYSFEAAEAGTEVTETWTDGRRGWPDLAAKIFDKTATGGQLFSEFQRRNIARTLARMKADFEDTTAV